MKRVHASLYWRLLTWFFVANLLALVLGGFLARRYISHAGTAKSDWTRLARDANQAYERGGRGALAAWSEQQRQRGVDATLIANGEPLYPIHIPLHIRAQLPAWLASGRSETRQPRPELHVAIQQVTGADGVPRQLVAISHSRLRRPARERIFLTTELALSLVFIGVIGWWVARSVAKPVEALRTATRRMAKGELSVRVGKSRRLVDDELARLAEDFDTMAERIEALVAHDRSVLRDVSHELRSPLTRLQLAVDLARSSDAPADAEPYFEQAEQEIIQLDQMLGQMLTLSRMEGGLPGMERERVDFGEVVRTCLERARLVADADNVELCTTSMEPAVVSGNASLLERAVDNLIANAIKFSFRHGAVEVALRTHRTCAELTVRDHGPGVPADELPLMFRPFFRGSNAGLAGGYGLGLAIVQRVVQVHAGSINARNAAGGGLEIHVQLPVA